jgi:hypothetical protein
LIRKRRPKMAGKCSRWQECESYGCEGCGYQHFDNILRAHSGNEILEFLGKEYFTSCSEGQRSRGGRISLDEPLTKLFKHRLPQNAKEVSSIEEELTINDERVLFKAKFDGGFEIDGKYIFYEVKGYGDNTNDVLSAIMAAQLLKTIPKYCNSKYYYIGISSGQTEAGLQRKHLQDPKRTKIYPYIKWAETKGFLKFFGIVDIEDLLKEIEEAIR